MSENVKITLEEAKKLYNSSEEAKTFLLSKFSKDELESKSLTSEVIITSTPRGLNEVYRMWEKAVDESVPSQEEFNKFFEENIFSQIDYSKTSFLDSSGYLSKIPTSRILLKNSNDEWLFDYDYDQKNPYFYYSHYRVYSNFQKQFSLQDVDRHRLMKSLVEKHFNLGNTQPGENKALDNYLVEKHFNLGNTQPDLATILNK